jgi:hypothetical protein
MGTPAFMPPEQVLGKASQIDALTDIWAVGATLFTLLSGHLVHEGETPQELMVKSATVRPRSLASVSRDLPPAVVSVIDRALEFDRAARWSSATGMRDALAEAYRSAFGEAVSSAPLVSLLAARDAAAAPTLLGDAPQAAELVAPNAPPSGVIAPTIDATSVLPTVGGTEIAPSMAAPSVTHLIGMTTSQPVSSEMPPPHPPSPPAAAPTPKRSMVATIAGVMLVILASGTTLFVWGRGGAADPARAGAAAGMPAVVATETAAVPSASASIAAATSAAPPSASASASSPALAGMQGIAVVTRPAVGRPALPPTSTSTQPRTGGSVIGPAAAAPGTASIQTAPRAPNCRNVPYVDPDGQTHFKKVCD